MALLFYPRALPAQATDGTTRTMCTMSDVSAHFDKLSVPTFSSTPSSLVVSSTVVTHITAVS